VQKPSKTPEEVVELQPCPFCGSDCVGVTGGGNPHTWVHCLGCDASGGATLSVPETVAVWNRRAARAQPEWPGENDPRVQRVRAIQSRLTAGKPEGDSNV